MKHLDICSIILLSLGLMGSACRKNDTEKSREPEKVALTGTWELQSIRSGDATLLMGQDWQVPVYLSLNEYGTASWFRQDEQTLEYCEAGNSAAEWLDRAVLNQNHLSIENSFLPAQTLAVDFAGAAPVDLEWERAFVDIGGAPCSVPMEPTPAVIEPKPGPSDDADASIISLLPAAYRVVQGRPMLFEAFDKDRDLKAISAIETLRSDYLKIQNDDKKNVILEIDFALPTQRFDALRIQMQMHSDTSGQFRPGRNILIATRDADEPVKWLDHLAGSQPGLGNRDEYFTATLRKNLSRYVLVSGNQLLLRLTVELDYSALRNCHVLGFVPCWERPALYVDFAGVDLLKFPGDQDQL